MRLHSKKYLRLKSPDAELPVTFRASLFLEVGALDSTMVDANCFNNYSCLGFLAQRCHSSVSAKRDTIPAENSNKIASARWLYNGGVPSGLIHRENGRQFLTPLVCADCLLTGWKAACSGKFGGVRRSSASFGPSEGCLSPLKRATRTNKWRQKTSLIFNGSDSTVIESLRAPATATAPNWHDGALTSGNGVNCRPSPYRKAACSSYRRCVAPRSCDLRVFPYLNTIRVQNKLENILSARYTTFFLLEIFWNGTWKLIQSLGLHNVRVTYSL